MDVHQCPRCRTRFRGEMLTCPVDGEPLQRLQDPLLGRTIAGRYVIEDKIGSGGMGVVYRARHEAIGRDVAIKFLHARHTRDLTHRQRFLGEARAANQINHENIIDITDFGETDDGLVYLVMEYLQGRSLDRELGGRPIAPARALRIAIQIAHGLARAHELDVIHRDVKPGNVFLVHRRNTEGDSVKLLDFGIAHFERELRITDRGTLLGTPEYIAPEQVRTGDVDAKTDLYALGCVLFEMLVGQPPFTGNMTEILIQQLRDEVEPPSRRSEQRGITPELDALVLKMLDKEPSRRHRDAFHLVEELRALLARMKEPPSAELGLPTDTAPSPPDAGASHDSAGQLTVHMPLRRDEWGERMQHYRRALHALHPNGEPPARVREAMQVLERTVHEAARLRSSLHGSAQQLADNQAEVRATRLRVGRALDELVSDESKLARALEAELSALRKAEADAALAVQDLLASRLVSIEPGRMLSEHEANALRALSAAIEKVRAAQRVIEHVRQDHDRRGAQLEDVRYQIEQLKLRFAALNASSTETQSAVQSRARSTELQLQTEMQQLITEAEHVAIYLRTHGAA